MSKSNTLLLTSSAIAASCLSTLYLAYSYYTNNKDKLAISDDYITPDLVCKFFDSLFVNMQSVLANLSQQIAQIQAAGQRIPEAQLRQLITAEFERALIVKQQQALDELDVDEDCMKEATDAYLKNSEFYPAVFKSVDRFRKLYDTVTGGSASDSSDSSNSSSSELLSPQKLVEAAEVYFNGLTETMRALVEQFKAQGLDVGDPTVSQKLQMQFAAVANEAGDEALKGKLGIDDAVFKRSLEKHSSSPDVGRALAMLQMKQQQEMMAMGISPGM